MPFVKISGNLVQKDMILFLDFTNRAILPGLKQKQNIISGKDGAFPVSTRNTDELSRASLRMRISGTLG